MVFLSFVLFLCSQHHVMIIYLLNYFSLLANARRSSLLPRLLFPTGAVRYFTGPVWRLPAAALWPSRISVYNLFFILQIDFCRVTGDLLSLSAYIRLTRQG